MGASIRDQTRYRGRDDDVALNVATWNGGGGIDTGWTQDVDVNFRIRFVILLTGMDDATNTFELWFDDGGGMEVMTASTKLQPAATSQYANGDTTTQILGGGIYTSGDSLGGVDDATDTGNCGFMINDEAELEWCLTIDGAQVADEDVLAVEVRLSGGTTITVSSALTALTINKAASADPIPDRFVNVTRQAVRRAANY